MKLDTILPSPAHLAKKKRKESRSYRKLHSYCVGTLYYALYCGPKRDRQPKWIAAVVTKVLGSRSVNVKVMPRGHIWKRHIDQLCLRHTNAEDAEPLEEIHTYI